MKIKPFLLGLSLVFGLFAFAACGNDYTAEDTAQIFCNYTKTGNDDIPQQRLTTQLAADIEAAKKVNDKFVNAAPSDKPPLGDGIPFQALQDTATGCEVRTISKTADGKLAEIRHMFPSEPSADWSDYLVLKNEDGMWRIDNVVFEKPESAHSLRSSLKTISEMTPP